MDSYDNIKVRYLPEVLSTKFVVEAVVVEVGEVVVGIVSGRRYIAVL